MAFTTNSSFVFQICDAAFQRRRNSPLRLVTSMTAPKLLWLTGVEPGQTKLGLTQLP